MSGKTASFRFPILRIVAGLLFVLAGISALYHVTLGFSLAIVFVAAGAVVIVLVLLGHRASGGDIALFVIALVLLAVVTTSYTGFGGTTIRTFSGARADFTSVNQLYLNATSGLGGISVEFSNNSALTYQVTFTRSAFSFFGVPVAPESNYSLTNVTRDGVLYLNATASSAGITVLLGRGYLTNIDARTGAGSVEVKTSQPETFGTVSLSTGAGSVDTTLSAERISSLNVSSGAGSVNIVSDSLAASGQRIPISISTGAGSVDLNLKIASGTAVSLSATANLGSITHSLQGFTISQSTNSRLEATAGDVSTAAKSFVISMSAGAGSITASAQILS